MIFSFFKNMSSQEREIVFIYEIVFEQKSELVSFRRLN